MSDAASAGGLRVTVAVAQIAPVVAEPVANQELAANAIREALAADAGVIVLPELASTGYHLTADEAHDLAESPVGPSVASWSAALGDSDALVVGGFCERGVDGAIYNSAAAVDRSGVVAVYRKTHLWAAESKIFRPGEQRPPVISTRWGPIGVAICYDLFFPEVIRRLALEGALLVAVPTNSPAEDLKVRGARAAPDGIGHVVARSAAYLSRIFVAVSDRCGDERGTSWTARSAVIGPEGEFLAGPVPYDSVVATADCDLARAVSKVWEGTTNDAFLDRRPDLY